MIQKIIGIYHSADLDGYSSGAIIKYKYPNAKLIGWDYGDPIPDIEHGSKVIMSDISFPIADMIRLGNTCELLWIDHHISSIKTYEETFPIGDPNFNTVLNSSIAACELTWGELFPDREMPEAISLLGIYDSWRNEDKQHWHNSVIPFQYGMRLICNSPKKFPERLLQGDSCLDIVETGRNIVEYQKQQNEYNCRRASFEVDFKGYKCVCLNGGPFNSLTFDSVYDISKHDIMMPFMFNGKKWTVSLYSTKEEIDCSVIAKSMGGGGHKGAAGFQVDNISSIIKL